VGQALKEEAPWKPVFVPTSYVTILDDEYPAVFKTLRHPPWILYYMGDLSFLDLPCAGIVGSRDVSEHGLAVTKQTVNILKEKYVIVSGLAKGVDAMAHCSALDRKTVGIIGCGLDRTYPRENWNLYEVMKEKHLIISEYPWGTPPLRRHFPWRNRLIAAASQVLVVTEAALKSGTLSTADHCVELGKPIACIPAAFGDKRQGCNYLISQGAQILWNEEEIRSL
jgi:DNA processing protein